MTYKPFNLEEAKAGKKFGFLHQGLFIEVLKWHYFEELKSGWPLRVILLDGSMEVLKISDPKLVMKPEEKVWYKNIYNSGDANSYQYKSVGECKNAASKLCLGQIKITVIGDDFTVEKVTEP